MPKFCPNCGRKANSKDRVCGNCGRLLKNEQPSDTNASQHSIDRKVNLRSARLHQSHKKKNLAYKWIIGISLGALLVGGGYLVYQNTTSANNSVVMKKRSSTTSSKKSDYSSGKSSTTESSDDSYENSSDDQAISTGENNNDQEDNDRNETVADIGPKTLASSVLLLGGKKSEAWRSFSTLDSLEVNVITPTTGIADNYSKPGNGVGYQFTSDGQNGGMILEYRISSDGSTVYCYEQSSRDAATRHVTPFATLSAKEILQVKDSARVKDLVNKIEIKS